MGLSDYLRRLLARGALRAYQALFEGKFKPGFQGVSDEPQFVKLADMQEDVVRLAHISDLHIGRHYDPKLRNLVDKLNAIKPHFLVVSGDLVHEPKLAYLRDARSVLQDLRNCCRALLVVPGNHDRHGELGLDDWAKELGTGVVPSYQCKVFELPDDRFVFFFLLNSTLAHTPDPISQQIHDIVQVRGWIDKDQVQWLRKTFSQIKGQYRTEYERGLKVVVLHHHLVPVGSESYLGEAFMTLGNSNEVLGILAEMKVDLVLHGHKHAPAIRTLDMQEQDHRLILLSAGGATAYTGDRLTSPEEDTETMSSQCAFFSIEWDGNDIAVNQYDYCNRLSFPNKFLPSWKAEFERDLPEYSKFEVDMAWTIHCPNTDWEVTETYAIQRQSGQERTEFTFDLGCTKEAEFPQLCFEVQRRLDDTPARATPPDEKPEPVVLKGEGQTWYSFKVPITLVPGLATGLQTDHLSFHYIWPQGFFEFLDRNYVDGTWAYPFRVDRLRLTVRFAGGRRVKALRVLAPGEKRPVVAQDDGHGAFSCEVSNIPANRTITYVIERD